MVYKLYIWIQVILNAFWAQIYLLLIKTCLLFQYCINFKGIKELQFKVSLVQGVFIPKLINNPQASCSLVNFVFLVLHISHFDNSTILSFFVFATFAFLLYDFYLHFYFKEIISFFIIIFFNLNSWLMFSSTIFIK